MIKKYSCWDRNPDQLLVYVSIASFFTLLLISLFFQLFLLPDLLASMHAGNGLLKGVDSYHYHELATTLAQNIETNGWSVWQLRPEGQAPAGWAAIIYVLSGIHEPWVLLPLNLLIHVLSFIVLVRIYSLLDVQGVAPILAAVPFLLFPTAMLWYAQLQKDGFFILGSFLFLYAGMKALSIEGVKCRAVLIAISATFFATFFVWLVRPYAVKMFLGLLIIFSFIAFFRVLLKRKTNLLVSPVSLLLCCLVALIPTWFGGSDEPGLDSLSQFAYEMPKQMPKQMPNPYKYWTANSWVPNQIGRQAQAIFVLRNSYYYTFTHARSNIDEDIDIGSVEKMIAYIPKAIMIAQFSPFPNMWIDASDLKTLLLRLISGAEMFMIYILFPFGIYFLWQYVSNVKVWAILAYCTFVPVLYALAIPNVGTLFRMTYSFKMFLVGVGVAGVCSLMRVKRNVG